MKAVEYRDGRVLLATSILGHVFGVTERAIRKWGANGCPQISRGRWDLKQVLEWRGLSEQKDEDELAPAGLKLFYETQLKKAQAEAMELKNDIATGRYIEKDSAAADLRKFVTVLKRSLLGLGRKVSTEASRYLEPVEARKLENDITAIIQDALEQMSVNGIYNAKKQI